MFHTLSSFIREQDEIDEMEDDDVMEMLVDDILGRFEDDSSTSLFKPFTQGIWGGPSLRYSARRPHTIIDEVTIVPASGRNVGNVMVECMDEDEEQRQDGTEEGTVIIEEVEDNNADRADSDAYAEPEPKTKTRTREARVSRRDRHKKSRRHRVFGIMESDGSDDDEVMLVTKQQWRRLQHIIRKDNRRNKQRKNRISSTHILRRVKK